MTQTQQRSVPLFTLDGVHDAEVSTHFITTGDLLGISAFRFLREPSDDVVLLIHGLTTSTDMFIMPEHYNLVDYLLDHGFTDVWCLDFRMSNRHSYNLRRHRYTMDDSRSTTSPRPSTRSASTSATAGCTSSATAWGRLVHDEPVRRGRHRHHQRHRQQRRPHPARARAGRSSSSPRRPSWSRPCSAFPTSTRGPARIRDCTRGRKLSPRLSRCSTASATCRPATCSA